MCSLMKLGFLIGVNNFYNCSRYCNHLNNLKNQQKLSYLYKRLYSKNNIDIFKTNDQNNNNVENNDIGLGVKSGKYKVFKDTDSLMVLDVEEERLLQEKEYEQQVSIEPQFEGINLTSKL
uniref:Uncharacterized protein n=1 Tax=Clastoptera arizonana TaxID=38151 RepID=A0A1B6D047_9HEMI